MMFLLYIPISMADISLTATKQFHSNSYENCVEFIVTSSETDGGTLGL